MNGGDRDDPCSEWRRRRRPISQWSVATSYTQARLNDAQFCSAWSLAMLGRALRLSVSGRCASVCRRRQSRRRTAAFRHRRK